MQMKPPRLGDETAEVMITVKTYPNPSETYGETVSWPEPGSTVGGPSGSGCTR